MKMIGLVRLGADAVLRHTPQGDPVLEISAAYNYGRKGSDERRPTQWIKLSMWGARAEKMAPYFTKGTQLLAFMDDVHVDTYKRDNGDPGFNLVGRLGDFEFAGGQRSNTEQQTQQQTPAERHRQAVQAQNDFYDDDIPF